MSEIMIKRNSFCYFKPEKETDDIRNQRFDCYYEILDDGKIEAKFDYSGNYHLAPNEPLEWGRGAKYNAQFIRDMVICDGSKIFLLKKSHTDPLFSCCSATEYFDILNSNDRFIAEKVCNFFSKTELNAKIKVKSIEICVKSLDRGIKKKFIENYNYGYWNITEKTKDELLEQDKNLLADHILFLTKRFNIPTEPQPIEINKHNISKISTRIDRDDLYNKDTPFYRYITINFDKAVDSSEVYDYVEEIAVYLQLFCPDMTKIEHVYTTLEDPPPSDALKKALEEKKEICREFYVNHPDMEKRCIENIDSEFNQPTTAEFVTHHLNFFYQNFTSLNFHLPSSKEVESLLEGKNILDFLKICYDKIAFRECDNDFKNDYFKNIKTFIRRCPSGIESHFLACFKFIECFYKKNLSDKDRQRTFITKMIKKYYYELQDELSQRKIQDILNEFHDKLKESRDILNKSHNELKAALWVVYIPTEDRDKINGKLPGIKYKLMKIKDALDELQCTSSEKKIQEIQDILNEMLKTNELIERLPTEEELKDLTKKFKSNELRDKLENLPLYTLNEKKIQEIQDILNEFHDKLKESRDILNKSHNELKAALQVVYIPTEDRDKIKGKLMKIKDALDKLQYTSSEKKIQEKIQEIQDILNEMLKTNELIERLPTEEESKDLKSKKFKSNEFLDKLKNLPLYTLNEKEIQNVAIEDLAHFIVCLRDHISHFGNSRPRHGIKWCDYKDEDKDKYKDEKIYRIENNQVYRIVKLSESWHLLKIIDKIATNIIFKDILEYKSHKFPKIPKSEYVLHED